MNNYKVTFEKFDPLTGMAKPSIIDEVIVHPVQFAPYPGGYEPLWDKLKRFYDYWVPDFPEVPDNPPNPQHHGPAIDPSRTRDNTPGGPVS